MFSVPKGSKLLDGITMIHFHDLARIRREYENILILWDELSDRGIPKKLLLKINILYRYLI